MTHDDTLDLIRALSGPKVDKSTSKEEKPKPPLTEKGVSGIHERADPILPPRTVGTAGSTSSNSEGAVQRDALEAIRLAKEAMLRDRTQILRKQQRQEHKIEQEEQQQKMHEQQHNWQQEKQERMGVAMSVPPHGGGTPVGSLPPAAGMGIPVPPRLPAAFGGIPQAMTSGEIPRAMAQSRPVLPGPAAVASAAINKSAAGGGGRPAVGGGCDRGQQQQQAGATRESVLARLDSLRASNKTGNSVSEQFTLQREQEEQLPLDHHLNQGQDRSSSTSDAAGLVTIPLESAGGSDIGDEPSTLAEYYAEKRRAREKLQAQQQGEQPTREAGAAAHAGRSTSGGGGGDPRSASGWSRYGGADERAAEEVGSDGADDNDGIVFISEPTPPRTQYTPTRSQNSKDRDACGGAYGGSNIGGGFSGSREKSGSQNFQGNDQGGLGKDGGYNESGDSSAGGGASWRQWGRNVKAALLAEASPPHASSLPHTSTNQIRANGGGGGSTSDDEQAIDGRQTGANKQHHEKLPLLRQCLIDRTSVLEDDDVLPSSAGDYADGTELGFVREDRPHLILSVLQGRNLIPPTATGKHIAKFSPYVIASYGGVERQTPMFQGGSSGGLGGGSVLWDQHLVFPALDHASPMMIMLFAKGIGGIRGDKALGKIEFTVPAIPRQNDSQTKLKMSTLDAERGGGNDPFSDFAPQNGPERSASCDGTRGDDDVGAVLDVPLCHAEWLQLQPCSNDDQDSLETRRSMASRRVERAFDATLSAALPSPSFDEEDEAYFNGDSQKVKMPGHGPSTTQPVMAELNLSVVPTLMRRLPSNLERARMLRKEWGGAAITSLEELVSAAVTNEFTHLGCDKANFGLGVFGSENETKLTPQAASSSPQASTSTSFAVEEVLKQLRTSVFGGDKERGLLRAARKQQKLKQQSQQQTAADGAGGAYAEFAAAQAARKKAADNLMTFDDVGSHLDAGSAEDAEGGLIATDPFAAADLSSIPSSTSTLQLVQGKTDTKELLQQSRSAGGAVVSDASPSQMFKYKQVLTDRLRQHLSAHHQAVEKQRASLVQVNSSYFSLSQKLIAANQRDASATHAVTLLAEALTSTRTAAFAVDDAGTAKPSAVSSSDNDGPFANLNVGIRSASARSATDEMLWSLTVLVPQSEEVGNIATNPLTVLLPPKDLVDELGPGGLSASSSSLSSPWLRVVVQVHPDDSLLTLLHRVTLSPSITSVPSSAVTPLSSTSSGAHGYRNLVIVGLFKQKFAVQSSNSSSGSGGSTELKQRGEVVSLTDWSASIRTSVSPGSTLFASAVSLPSRAFKFEEDLTQLGATSTTAAAPAATSLPLSEHRQLSIQEPEGLQSFDVSTGEGVGQLQHAFLNAKAEVKALKKENEAWLSLKMRWDERASSLEDRAEFAEQEQQEAQKALAQSRTRCVALERQVSSLKEEGQQMAVRAQNAERAAEDFLTEVEAVSKLASSARQQAHEERAQLLNVVEGLILNGDSSNCSLSSEHLKDLVAVRDNLNQRTRSSTIAATHLQDQQPGLSAQEELRREASAVAAQVLELPSHIKRAQVRLGGEGLVAAESHDVQSKKRLNELQRRASRFDPSVHQMSSRMSMGPPLPPTRITVEKVQPVENRSAIGSRKNGDEDDEHDDDVVFITAAQHQTQEQKQQEHHIDSKEDDRHNPEPESRGRGIRGEEGEAAAGGGGGGLGRPGKWLSSLRQFTGINKQHDDDSTTPSSSSQGGGEEYGQEHSSLAEYYAEKRRERERLQRQGRAAVVGLDGLLAPKPAPPPKRPPLFVPPSTSSNSFTTGAGQTGTGMDSMASRATRSSLSQAPSFAKKKHGGRSGGAGPSGESTTTIDWSGY